MNSLLLNNISSIMGSHYNSNYFIRTLGSDPLTNAGCIRGDGTINPADNCLKIIIDNYIDNPGSEEVEDAIYCLCEEYRYESIGNGTYSDVCRLWAAPEGPDIYRVRRRDITLQRLSNWCNPANPILRENRLKYKVCSCSNENAFEKGVAEGNRLCGNCLQNMSMPCDFSACTLADPVVNIGRSVYPNTFQCRTIQNCIIYNSGQGNINQSCLYQYICSGTSEEDIRRCEEYQRRIEEEDANKKREDSNILNKSFYDVKIYLWLIFAGIIFSIVVASILIRNQRRVKPKTNFMIFPD